jgi:hypothetical protein
MAFATFLLSSQALLPSTISKYICSVRSFCVDIGQPISVFSGVRLARLIRGIKRLGSKPTRLRMPITVALLRKMLALLSTAPAHLMLAAVLTVGVFGLMRSGELTYKSSLSSTITRADVSWLSEGRVDIWLAASKTDVFRHGVTIRIFRVFGDLCPYSVLRTAWDSAPDNSPFAPLFQEPNGQPFRYRTLLNAIKRLAACLGLDPDAFACHSLRIGGATSLALMGVPDHLIKTLGRWESLSYQLYIRASNSLLSEGMQSMARHILSSAAPSFAAGVFGGLSLSSAAGISMSNCAALFSSR